MSKAGRRDHRQAAGQLLPWLVRLGPSPQREDGAQPVLSASCAVIKRLRRAQSDFVTR